MDDISSKISAVVCTRNRGNSVVATLETILANTHPHFEVILVDQSTNQATAQAIDHLRTDCRLRYVPSNTRGAGRARNIGLSLAQGSIVAFTDDDCTVPSDWLEGIARIFALYPHVAMVFCNVDPAPHDSAAGFIPCYQRHNSVLVQTMWDKCQARGIGAGMAVRRAAITAVGGFDESLGPGTTFSACEEGDLAVRMLINNWWVYETHEVAVVHHGFRTWQEGKDLTKRDWFGIGVAYVKSVKCGYWQVAIVIACEGIKGVMGPITALARLKKPQGARRIWYLCLGILQGLKTPVDRQRIMYKLD